MVRDGDILSYGHPCAIAYSSVADPVTAERRAGSLAHLIPGRCAVGGASAIWVHAGGPAPHVVTVASPRGSRQPRGLVSGVRYRSTAPPAQAVTLVGDVRVVRPEIALFDLLHDPEASQASVTFAARMLGVDPVALLNAHPSARRPYASLARRRAALVVATGS